MFDEYDFDQEDFDQSSALSAQDDLEQQRWEEDNNVDSLLKNDPGYTKWADEMDRQADEDREILALADIESERKFTSSAWD